jgi:hypothetical protein
MVAPAAGLADGAGCCGGRHWSSCAVARGWIGWRGGQAELVAEPAIVPHRNTDDQAQTDDRGDEAAHHRADAHVLFFLQFLQVLVVGHEPLLFRCNRLTAPAVPLCSIGTARAHVLVLAGGRRTRFCRGGSPPRRVEAPTTIAFALEPRNSVAVAQKDESSDARATSMTTGAAQVS